jgi:DNA processing protein
MQTENESMIKDAIELALLPGVGGITQNRIWKSLPRISDLYSMEAPVLESLGIPGEAHSIIRARSYQAIAAEIYDWGIREGCRFLMRGNPGYPSLLEEIHDPPLIMYARGHMEALEKPSIAIVGTRRPTVYGLQMAQGIALDLASRISIVSGLA